MKQINLKDRKYKIHERQVFRVRTAFIKTTTLVKIKRSKSVQLFAKGLMKNTDINFCRPVRRFKTCQIRQTSAGQNGSIVFIFPSSQLSGQTKSHLLTQTDCSGFPESCHSGGCLPSCQYLFTPAYYDTSFCEFSTANFSTITTKYPAGQKRETEAKSLSPTCLTRGFQKRPPVEIR